MIASSAFFWYLSWGRRVRVTPARMVPDRQTHYEYCNLAPAWALKRAFILSHRKQASGTTDKQCGGKEKSHGSNPCGHQNLFIQFIETSNLSNKQASNFNLFKPLKQAIKQANKQASTQDTGNTHTMHTHKHTHTGTHRYKQASNQAKNKTNNNANKHKINKEAKYYAIFDSHLFFSPTITKQASKQQQPIEQNSNQT